MSTGTGVKPTSEDVKKIAFEKVAQLKVYNINLILDIINLASRRGAFNLEELSQVGAIGDILKSGVNKAIDMAEEEYKKEQESKIVTEPLSIIKEEVDEA